MPFLRHAVAIVFVVALSLHSACAAEVPVAPEVNPPGDIPDSQVFVTYRSPDGYSLKVPEGWARASANGQVSFSDKYNTITIGFLAAPHAAIDRIRTELVPQIAGGPHAAKLDKVRVIKIKNNDALQIDYTVNSELNAVTGKQIRLEAERTYYPAGDMVLVLDLTAPQGADNTDQWTLISRSVRLK